MTDSSLMTRVSFMCLPSDSMRVIAGASLDPKTLQHTVGPAHAMNCRPHVFGDIVGHHRKRLAEERGRCLGSMLKLGGLACAYRGAEVQPCTRVGTFSPSNVRTRMPALKAATAPSGNKGARLAPGSPGMTM